MSSHVPTHEVQAFCDRYRSLPMTSVGLSLPGIPSVLIDNAMGLHDVFAHLIQGHDFRRILFACGPEGNAEARQRYQTYVETLQEHGIDVDPNLVLPNGRFERPWGRDAMQAILDERQLRPGVDFDAVVCANDAAALGAIDHLQDRGFHIPNDVAVAGYDDVEDAVCITPPLTTVRQPLYKQGRRAAEMLFALLDGERVPEQAVLPTQMVVRRSCGCMSQAAQQVLPLLDAEIGPPPDGSFEATFARARESLRIAMLQTPGFPPDLAPETFDPLLDTIAAEIAARSSDAFLPAFNRILPHPDFAALNATAWHQVISTLSHYVLPLLGDDPAGLSHAASLFQQARVLTGEIEQEREAYHKLQVEDIGGRLTETGSELLLANALSDLAETLPGQQLRYL